MGTSTVAGLLDDVRFDVLPLPGTADLCASVPRDAKIAVTALPAQGGEPTLALAEDLAAAGRHVAVHLAARHVRQEAHLKEVLRRLEAAGVHDVFVVAGDVARPAGPFDSGLALLEAMADLGVTFPQVGVPAYPQGHPRIEDRVLLDALHAKQEHATYLVTQMAFDHVAVLEWLRRIRRAGISLPVYVGLPGMVDRTTLMSTALRIGITDSVRFLTSNRRMARRLFGPTLTGDLVHRLAAALRPEDGVAGVHLYTFNRVGPTALWLASARG